MRLPLPREGGPGRTRRIALPAVMALAMLAALLWLGTWQLQRREWKRGLLAEIDAAETSAPAPLTSDPKPFAKVIASGVLRPDLAARYGAEVRDGRLGARLLVPLASERRTVLADLGWIADGVAPALPEGPVEVTGFVRPPDRPGLVARAVGSPDQPADRRFYVLDPARVAPVIGLSLAPYVLVALAPVAPGVQPATALPRPPNDHLSYAITWFGLALGDIAIFTVYILRRTRA